MQCTKCGKGIMKETIHRKWSPRLGYLLVDLFILIVFLTFYGIFSSKWGSENVMPVFMGLTPLVIAPFVFELRRRKYIHGWECTACGYFLEKPSE